MTRDAAFRRPYPVNLRLDGRRVVVVGAGSIAEGKIESLRNTGAVVHVIGRQATPQVHRLAEEGLIGALSIRSVRRLDIVGAALVIAATDHRPTNRRIRRWARWCGAVVNVVDDPELCDVTIPAVVHRGSATISVSTNGASPAAARFLREQLECELPLGVGELVDHAARARQQLRAEGTYRYDYPAWRQRFLEPGWQAIRLGRTEALDEIRRRLLAGFSGPTPVATGSVALIGAGPGGVELLTIGGARALSTADVVVYDRLVDPAVLDLAPSAAERIPVGKGKGWGTSQEEINRLLIDRAMAGFTVARLKGGDPFVFGRGYEELEAVTGAGIDCRLVPGLSSSVAGPALAGIPVTHRGLSASFTVLTAHRMAEADYDWSVVANSGETLIVLMGASTAAQVGRRLVDAGRPDDEPVAVVHRAGRPESQSARLTLDELARTGSPFTSPSIIVIGAVAALRRLDEVFQPAGFAGLRPPNATSTHESTIGGTAQP